MERATLLWIAITIAFAVVLGVPTTAGQAETDVAQEDAGQIFTHLHIPFPKKRLLKQQILYSTRVVALPTEVVCSSLMGPDCFIPVLYRGEALTSSASCLQASFLFSNVQQGMQASHLPWCRNLGEDNVSGQNNVKRSTRPWRGPWRGVFATSVDGHHTASFPYILTLDVLRHFANRHQGVPVAGSWSSTWMQVRACLALCMATA